MKIIYILPLLIMSCLTPYEPQLDKGLPGDGDPITLVAELFAKTGYSDGKKVTTFLLNNNKYWSEHGYTLWAVDPGNAEEIFTAREVGLIKTSGNNLAGYGLVICQGLREGYGRTMLTIMINTEQNYAIGKVIGANYQSIRPWVPTSYLWRGYGVKNQLKITYDAGSKEFTLIVNGHEVEKFKDDTPPSHEGGVNGYIVVISPQDRFPAVPVEVKFLE